MRLSCIERFRNYVINAVNKIKSKVLNTRLFAQLCDENDEEFQRFLEILHHFDEPAHDKCAGY